MERHRERRGLRVERRTTRVGREREQTRTIFAVGDEKQSIFSFQGADPSQFDINRRHFADVHKRFVYVTDGGHWENLGLVELLRRGCGQILCFDAAGDDLKHFSTLSQVNVVYGSLTTAIVVLLSLEIAATLLLFGAQVISEYERLERGSPAGTRATFRTD